MPNCNVQAEQSETGPDTKNKKRLSLFVWVPFLFLIVVILWWLIRWAQHRGCFEWVPDWLFLDSGPSAPVATLLASGGVIIAAVIAFWNGEKTRRAERGKWVESKQREDKRREEEQAKWEESKQQETVRSLRDRYFNITELLSENSSYAQREAAVYSLAALSDDWASFYGDATEAATREQQTCLNVIVGQLRDPLSEEEDHEKTKERSELIVFKQRVQGVIAERYQSSISPAQRAWSHLDLNLSFCHLYEPHFTGCVFAKKALFNSATFIGWATFEEAKFTGSVDFQYAKFTHIVDFQGVEFTTGAYFRNTTFDSFVDFRGAKFTREAFFQGAKFTGGDTDFRGAKFTGNTYFWDALFTGVTNFRQVSFAGNIDFWGVKFAGKADFREATCAGKADFWGVSFTDDTDFGEATFAGRADFGEATFAGRADFGEATFAGRVGFTRANFLAYAVFGETEDQICAGQDHEDHQITSTKREGAVFKKSPFFDGPSQFTQLPQFNGTRFPTCPTLTDDSDPRGFFAKAIFLDEQDSGE